MATVRFSTYPGAKEADIVQTVGSATATSNIELTVDLGNTMNGNTRVINKNEVLYSLVRLADFIVESKWPPQ
ncbi:MAG: hypothetical protein ABUL58_00230 [Steroidobacter sp.]